MFFFNFFVYLFKRARIYSGSIENKSTNEKTMTNDERKKKKEEIDNINVCYCTKCMSLKVLRKNTKEFLLYCGNCGADAFHLDSTNIYRWIELCEERGKSNLIAKKTSVYDDLDEVYSEQAVEKITEAECIENGQASGVKITDYLYRNLHNLEKRSSPTENVKNQLTEKAVEQLTADVMNQIADNNDNNAINPTINE